MIYVDNSKYMIWKSYRTHPPVTYVSREKAKLCHFIGHVPSDNNKPFIKEIEHILYVPGMSRNYTWRLQKAPRIEQEFRSVNCKAIFGAADSVLRQVSYHIDTSGMENKLHLVYSACSDQPDNLHQHSDLFTILTISNKFWGRGIPLAIETFRALRAKYGKTIRMRLVCEDVPADYPLVEGLELIQVNRLDSQLRRKLYQEANIFLLLGLMQFGVALETMAYGIPTVSTPNCDKGGWILSGQTGLIVEPPFSLYDKGFGIEWKTWNQFCGIVKMRFERGDLSYMIEEAIAHVEFLMNNPDKLQLMGQAAQKQQRTKHSYKVRNKQVLQIYTRILHDLL